MPVVLSLSAKRGLAIRGGLLSRTDCIFVQTLVVVIFQPRQRLLAIEGGGFSVSYQKWDGGSNLMIVNLQGFPVSKACPKQGFSKKVKNQRNLESITKGAGSRGSDSKMTMIQ